jgi:hypothetical protein
LHLTLRLGLAETAGGADAASLGRNRLDGFRWPVHLRPRLGDPQADRKASKVTLNSYGPPSQRNGNIRKLKMTDAWKTMVADAIAKPPAKRSSLESESIRVALHLSWLGKRLERLMKHNEDEISDEQFRDALVEIRDELLH